MAVALVLTAIPSVAAASTGVAFVDPTDGRWYLPDGAGDFASFSYGDAGDTPIGGDWDCDGIDSPGRFRADGYFYLRNAFVGGEGDISFHFGAIGDRPLVGDWNGNGCDTVAVFRPAESVVYSADRLGLHTAWRSQQVRGEPVVADFDGDGADDILGSNDLVGYRPRSELAALDDLPVLGPETADLFYGRVGDRAQLTSEPSLGRLIPVAGNFRPACTGCGGSRPSLQAGDTGAWVEELRVRLAGLGFRPGTGAGYDHALGAAVVAFEKYHRLERDGVFASDHWGLLDQAIAIPYRVDSPDRVEVDLERQILILVLDHTPAGIIPVSSANGETYTSWNGNTVTARTPEGDFSFYRSESGWYRSYLGGLYEPFFFRGGYAIHGSGSVPAYPASHGCIRTQIADQDWLKPQLDYGMEVFVYGVRTEAPELPEA
ncbi:MAG: L,D-transpeptidase family protein [Acidimicrobiia bacterium]